MCEGAHVHVVAGTDELITKRLRLRPWRCDDADAALAIFGQQEVARWLTPAVPRVADRDEMRQLLPGGSPNTIKPGGHWATGRSRSVTAACHRSGRPAAVATRLHRPRNRLANHPCGVGARLRR